MKDALRDRVIRDVDAADRTDFALHDVFESRLMELVAGQRERRGGDQAAVARDDVSCRSISLARAVASSTVSYADHSSVQLLQITL